MRVWTENTQPCHGLHPGAVSEEAVSKGNTTSYKQWILSTLHTLGQPPPPEAVIIITSPISLPNHEWKQGVWPWSCSWGFPINLTGLNFHPWIACNICLCGRLYQTCSACRWWQDWHYCPRASRDITLNVHISLAKSQWKMKDDDEGLCHRNEDVLLWYNIS